ncbi:CRR6 family NdhI maturation factor [Cyanobacterium stanieri LEGE 03274]|uniref:CRR6 family NdhI maturation factor n=1 Tax=Cyanobacterium stanieri LEGE 03274 TaxID=1828756 RepID=A0ABR9V435_9CHRO|nr:CRR6 family NdhI maturation factor [Cyanobacterium stanieri]MBE9222638.1 CRR6 family NdhI maturation factor [Cyanobacterium stanieri LEGE 03274]
MTIDITINNQQIETLDLSAVTEVVEDLEKREGILSAEQQIQFKIDYTLPENDPRELSEIPEIRLWFIALNALYPWFPILLNWREGELARYTAMVVPHEFKRTEGIQYNPEALDIFIMGKIFTLHQWLKSQGVTGNSRLKAMAQIFGYDLDDSFFALLG